jgi:methyl-accepting chemotaxis protein
MFNRMSLKTKLASVFGIFLLIILALVGVSRHALKDVQSKYEVIANENLPQIIFLSEIRDTQRNTIISIATLVGSKTTAHDAEETRQKTQSYYEKYKKNAAGFEAFSLNAKEQKLWDETKKNWEDFEQMTNKMLDLCASEKTEDQALRDKIFETDYKNVRMHLLEALGTLIDSQKHNSDLMAAEALENGKFAENLQLMLALIGILVGSAMGFLFTRMLSSALSQVQEQISGAASQTSAASEQLSQASANLSSGSNEAASSLQETVASLEELTSIVKHNADHAREASDLSSHNKTIAEQGHQEIRNLVVAMDEMKKESKQIEDIISLIDDIAFQTNLLALNAAVEAARAGDQGRGFAVVAEAVRSLAQKSALAAKDIANLIKANVDRVEKGSKIADSSGEILKNILESVRKVANINDEISKASQEQSSGIQQISQAMNQLDQATQVNAGSASEIAASSEEMCSQAMVLLSSVENLQNLVKGKAESKIQPTVARRDISVESSPSVTNTNSRTVSPLAKFEQDDFLKNVS